METKEKTYLKATCDPRLDPGKGGKIVKDNIGKNLPVDSHTLLLFL